MQIIYSKGSSGPAVTMKRPLSTAASSSEEEGYMDNLNMFLSMQIKEAVEMGLISSFGKLEKSL